ncbi:hypothetical protein LTR95_008910 [Oleoguttula sp. CCFEE 5521]
MEKPIPAPSGDAALPEVTKSNSVESSATKELQNTEFDDVGSEKDESPSANRNLYDVEKGEVKSEEPKAQLSANDWSSPHDRENPQNWSTGKKAYHTFSTAFLGFAVTCGSSLITPATPEIAREFGVSRTAAILTLSLYTLGLALGPILAAPVSETAGRLVVYKITAPCFMLLIVGAGFSKSFGSLLVCRLLAGTLGGPVLAVGAGTNADMYSARDRAVASAFFIMMPFLGPSLGPVIGGFAAQYKGWRWTQWCTIFIGIAATIPVFFMSETYRKVLLRRRAKRLDLPPPPTPPVTKLGMIKVLLTITLLRPLHMLVTEPIVALFSMYNAFTFSVLFAFFTAYPFTFESVYGFNTWQYGLTFLGIGLGVLCAVVTAILVDKTYYAKHHRIALSEGRVNVAPEYRLLAGQLGSLGIPIGLFWFAWSARADVHWISPVLAGIPFAWGNLCIFISAATYLIDIYGPLNGASALAANGVARYSMGAVFPLFTFQMYSRLGVAWATSLLAFISVAMLPIPWIFFKYGPKIRAKSQYDVVKF